MAIYLKPRPVVALLAILVSYQVGAAELQYLYYFDSQTYSTLSAAETAMRSAGANNQNLEQYRQQFDNLTGKINFKYKVFDIAARQVGPRAYTTPSQCADPKCYTEQEAYDALNSQYEAAGWCDVVSTPTGPWVEVGWGYTAGFESGQVWPDGIAYHYKAAKRPFNTSLGRINADGVCVQSEVYGYRAYQWDPWGCPSPYRNVTVNDPNDTCRITAQATITAKPIQFCGPETEHPIRPLTGEKVLRHEDITLSDIRLSRFYHSSGQSLITHRLAPGWQHSFSQYLMLNGSTPSYAVREDGNFVRLRYAGSGFTSNGQPKLIVQAITGGFRLTLPNGTVETYSKDTANYVSNLISIEKPNGPIINIEYDTAKRISYVRSSAGQYLQFVYSNGKLTTITDNMGRILVYGYDAQGNLNSVQYPDNTVLRYHYEDPRFPEYVSGVTDQRGIRYSTFSYDASGRATTSYLATGADRIDMAYGADGMQTATNSLGAQSTFIGIDSLGMKLVSSVTGPGCAGCGAGNTSYTYDPANNNLLRQVENGITTQYGSYDAKGQYGYRIEAVGTPEESRADYTYDPRFHNKVTTVTESSLYQP